MTTELWLRDLAAFALQAAVLIGVGAAVWRALGVQRPIATHRFWRTLLLACVLLPFCQPWKVSTTPAANSAPVSESVPTQVEGQGLQREQVATIAKVWPFGSSDVAIVALAAGMVFRALWFLLGAYKLRRLRRTAVRLEPAPFSVRDAQTRVGVHADVYSSNDIAGPITFGFRRPVVMLPPAVLSMENDLQDAILTHELLHVRRRDWLHLIIEEAIRTMLWFHPGIWWLINRIQLTREHVVDEAVIRLTQSRDHYVQALLAVAASRARGALVPAPLFLRRRFLKRRVAHILQETTMTTRRLLASVTASACALALAALFAVRAFPIEARSTEQGKAQRGSPSVPIQIAEGSDHLLHSTPPAYPQRAIEQRIEGDVVLTLTIDDLGEVSDASVVSGPAELRRAALESVLQWHYSPEAMRSTSTQAVIRFRLPAATIDAKDLRSSNQVAYTVEGRAVAGKLVEARTPSPELEALIERYKVQHREYVEALAQRENAERAGLATRDEVLALRQRLIETEHQLERLRVASRQEAQAQSVGSRVLREVRTERLSPEIAETILDRAEIKVGDQMTVAAMNRLREATISLDPHVRVSFHPASGVLTFSVR